MIQGQWDSIDGQAGVGPGLSCCIWKAIGWLKGSPGFQNVVRLVPISRVFLAYSLLGSLCEKKSEKERITKVVISESYCAHTKT